MNRLRHQHPRSCRSWLLTLAIVAILLPESELAAKPATEVKVPPGFHAELVYAPPLEVEGSWVSLTVDRRGHLIASDQEGALYRVTPPPIGAKGQRPEVERIELGIGMAQGLACVGDDLYVMLNGIRGALTSGLYRLSDANGDDRYDKVEQLRVWNGAGEHGPHAVVAGPNGKSLYICCGNNTRLPLYDRTRVPKAWQEDRLLPPLFAGELRPGQFEAPGGWIARTDLNGELLELYAAGYRNMYDVAFNADGELFTFDSDVESDVGLPWYRPTRVCHVTSGVDMGWRATDAVWSPRYLDSLPAVVDAGPGSPTGLEFAGASKFPAKYQRAMFAGEWSYGKIYAIHLTPQGSTYGGEIEQFASGMPLPVTDLAFSSHDGALYFVVGGRKIESGLYRIWWAGDAPQSKEIPASAADAPIDPKVVAAGVEARKVRKDLEASHVGAPEGAVEKAWPHLASHDPALRSAARIVLEHQPIERWGERVLNSDNARERIVGLAAMARVGAPVLGDVWTEALRRIEVSELDADDQFDFVRAAELGVLRLELSPANREKLLSRLDPLFPSEDPALDGELASLLARLETPKLIPRLLAAVNGAAGYSEAIGLARALSVVRGEWTIDERRDFLAWFNRAAHEASAGNFKTLAEIRLRFVEGIGAGERGKLIRDIGPRFEQPANPLATANNRRVVREWNLQEAEGVVDTIGAEADAKRGRKLFVVAQCSRCHAFAGAGAAVGPDLTGVGGRFSVHDLLRSMINPSETISDQYRQTLFTVSGKVFAGRVSNMDGDEYFVSTDMLDPTKYVKFNKHDLDDERPSDISMMPTGLLNTLTAEELADLVAYLRSGVK